MKATIISISDIIFALVQYQMISFLHCYFSEAHFAIELILLTFLFLFFRLKLLKSEIDKLQLTDVSARFDVIFHATSDEDDLIRVDVPILQFCTLTHKSRIWRCFIKRFFLF